MNSLLAQKLAIWLDTIAFICVTLDLWGNERLARVHDRLVNLHHLNRAENLVYWCLGKLETAGFLLAGKYTVVLAAFFWPALIFKWTWAWVAVLIIASPLIIVPILFLVLLTFSFVTYVAQLAVLLILHKYNFRGLLLAFGAVIFMLSKLTTYAALDFQETEEQQRRKEFEALQTTCASCVVYAAPAASSIASYPATELSKKQPRRPIMQEEPFVRR